jgi:hypothetical protein
MIKKVLTWACLNAEKWTEIGLDGQTGEQTLECCEMTC